MDHEYYISLWSGNLWRLEVSTKRYQCRFHDNTWSSLSPLHVMSIKDLRKITDDEAFMEIL